MIQHDLTHWPLVITVSRGLMTNAEHVQFLADWTGWLDRGERFALLRVFADDGALQHPEGKAEHAKAAKAWLKANSESIRSQIVGMATLVPPAHMEQASQMNAEKLFGVPAQAFGNADLAMDWLTDRLAVSDLPVSIDEAAARERLLEHLSGPRPSV